MKVDRAEYWCCHFYTGGNLVLARGGVCLVGNLACLKKDQGDKLQQSEFG